MKKKVLVTGAKGFVGKNLCALLRENGYESIYEYDIDSSAEELNHYCRECEFVFNLAGVNRPKDVSEFMSGNAGFSDLLLDSLKEANNCCPVMLSSSIQASSDSPYGLSKRAAEDIMFDYSRKTGAEVFVYRFPNLFGMWCRPNYNSAVSTFCHNIARGLDITVNNTETVVTLAYIADVTEELLRAVEGNATREGEYCTVKPQYAVKLGDIASLIYSFADEKSLLIPDVSDEFAKKLYSTYLSYLPEDRFSYALDMKTDARGSFTEAFKNPVIGQISVNVAKPGITKGNHWHTLKCEKFLVVSGKAEIKFRKITSDEVICYSVCGEKPEVVNIPVGYTHNITNIGDTDLVTIMWANEAFNPDKADTFFMKV